MTSPQEMQPVFKALWQYCQTDISPEWTMEANPSSVDRKKLTGYREIGINRISMGVQALRDDHLLQLGRVHNSKAVFEALDALFETGFENVSVDLLCGVPGQSLEDLQQALEKLVLGYPLQHLSCYLLTLPKHHSMAKDLPSDSTQLEHLLFIDEWMESHGFEHYEVSNFCKPGRQALHNLVYWHGQSYLGLGPSAHSYDGILKQRWQNTPSIHQYASLLSEHKRPIAWTETLTGTQLEIEKWMLKLRLAEGIPRNWIQTREQQDTLCKLEEEKLISVHPQNEKNYRLTPRGFTMLDSIVLALLPEKPADTKSTQSALRPSASVG